MARGLTAGMLAEVVKSLINPALFLEATFISGTIYVWSGYGPVVWNGHTWTGLGDLGKVSAIEETIDTRAAGIRLELSGLNPDLLNKALNECRQGDPVILYFGTLTDAGAVIADPYQAFNGLMDVPTIDEKQGIISITVESELLDLKRAPGTRFTHEDQQIEFPGDLGFEYVAQLQNKTLKWGASDAARQGTPSGTGGGGRTDGGGIRPVLDSVL